VNRFNTDSDKVSAAQDLVDRLHRMAETVEFNARQVSGDDFTQARLDGRAEGFRKAAWLLDQLL
jgi:hypothetical protein